MVPQKICPHPNPQIPSNVELIWKHVFTDIIKDLTMRPSRQALSLLKRDTWEGHEEKAETRVMQSEVTELMRQPEMGKVKDLFLGPLREHSLLTP